MNVHPASTTANKILNRVAAETGSEPVSDPFATSDPVFVQLRELLNIAGEELAIGHPWEMLAREHQVTTQSTDSGDYPLPEDFNYITNQTGWERAGNVPLFGPLSPQDWQYLLGRDLVSYTIYASFRLRAGFFSIFPQPPPDNLDIHFEYTSTRWVQDGNTPTTFKDEVEAGNDVPVFHRVLLSRYLKLKYLQAKDRDTVAAQDDFNQMFSFLTGLERGAEILSAGRNRAGFPYLDTYRNVPDTNFGSI